MSSICLVGVCVSAFSVFCEVSFIRQGSLSFECNLSPWHFVSARVSVKCRVLFLTLIYILNEIPLKQSQAQQEQNLYLATRFNARVHVSLYLSISLHVYLWAAQTTLFFKSCRITKGGLFLERNMAGRKNKPMLTSPNDLCTRSAFQPWNLLPENG